MQHATSSDGTRIAYDTVGSGPALVLIGGALSDRKFSKLVQLATLVSDHFTVVNYDRRGRGDSTDTPPYSVEREVDDLRAVIDAAGGRASVWGFSSGAILAVRAAAAGVPIDKLALYEPPFLVDDSRQPPPADLHAQLARLVAEDRRSDAIRLLFVTGMGMPAIIPAIMRLTPIWRRLKRVAHTIPYDWALLGDDHQGNPLDPADWAGVQTPAVVLSGQKSPAQLRNAARALAAVLPMAEHVELRGQNHNPSMKALAPVLVEHLAAGRAHEAAAKAAVPPVVA